MLRIEALCRVAILLITTEALLLVLSVLLWLAEASLIGVLGLGGVGVTLGVSLAGEQLHAVAGHLICGTLITVLILPIPGGQTAGHTDQVTLVSVLAQILCALLPYHEVQKVRGVLHSGSLDSQRKGTAGGATLGSSQLRLVAEPTNHSYGIHS
jgi:hypothetical protein